MEQIISISEKLGNYWKLLLLLLAKHERYRQIVQLSQKCWCKTDYIFIHQTIPSVHIHIHTYTISSECKDMTKIFIIYYMSV